MKILLSPTKTMEIRLDYPLTTPPLFEKESEAVKTALFETLKKTDLKTFYKVSEKKEKEVKALLEAFETNPKSPALFSFTGLVYKYLDSLSLEESALRYLDSHLLIFSGLYGLLRPFDQIRPYRLDYENPLKIDEKTLEVYWAEKIAHYLNNEANLIFNLASKEYYKPLLEKLEVPVYTFDFKVTDGKTLKTKATLSKMARGEMLRLMAQKRVTSLDEALTLTPQGFTYNETLSKSSTLLFTKNDTTKKA